MNDAFRHTAVAFLLTLLVSGSVHAQDDFREAFRSFAEFSGRAFDQFSDSASQDFLKAVMQQWQEFTVFEGLERDRMPEPSNPRVAVTPQKTDVMIDIDNVPVMGSVSWPDPVSGVTVTGQDAVDRRDIGYDFYGNAVSISIPAILGSFHPDGIGERNVAAFWQKLDALDCTSITAACLDYRKRLGLNDWGVFQFVTTMARAVFPENRNGEQAIFTVYILNETGLMGKVARVGDSLTCLFASMQPIYSRKYVEVGTYRYYLADDAAVANTVYTYQVDASDRLHPFNLNLQHQLMLQTRPDSYVTRHSNALGVDLEIPLGSHVLDFYASYPQTDVNVYATAVPQHLFVEALAGAIGPGLEGKSQKEALDLLLNFMQIDFSYKTDMEQFGYEKPFFCEENFRYAFNDCEDRSILFCMLVKRLLGLRCLLLEYPNHVNCAVALDEPALGSASLDSASHGPVVESGAVKGIYVKRGDSKYYVCDPTYIGSTVGMSGVGKSTKPQKVWILE